MDMSSLSLPLQTTAGALVSSGCSFVFILYLYTKIWSYKTGKDIGVPAIDELSAQIRAGAKAFLVTEYSFLAVFVLALAGTLFSLFYVTTPDDALTTATAVAVSLSPCRRVRGPGLPGVRFGHRCRSAACGT